MVTKDIIEEYTKYIDPSEMIIEYYKNQTTTGLEKYFLQIEDWLASDLPADQNKPLVIQADEGVGKKTLLVQWMQYHQQKSQKNFPDLVISHFAGTEGNNQNYFYAIYKILVRIREHFDISQKVELLEDKLESYFRYWLEVCSKALIGRIVDDSTIILVFEGINLFKDPDTKEEANVSLWLPPTFPERIRVIVTAESDSHSLEYFERINCQIINIENEPVVLPTIINQVQSRESFIVDEEYKQRVIQILNNKPKDALNSLFIKTYLSTLLPYPSENLIKDSDINKEEFKSVFQKMDYKKLESITEIHQLNMYLLEYFSQNITDLDKFRGVLVALNLTEKGLSEMEIFTLTGINTKEWNYILAIFKTFMMKYRDLWKINNETFKKAIRSMFQEDAGYATQLHADVAEILNKKTSNSIRKLEEETYHLFMSRNYFKLKEAVANIENFLLLFNPNNKYDLCRYWQTLEQRGFDPAAEYTKAVEGFELHYRPNQEDTFMIIIQVSRFLKEFSDFETNFTPQFRHPPIKGGPELQEIGLRREIKKLGMYQPEEWEPEDEQIDELDELEHKLNKEFPDYSDTMIKEMVQQIHSATRQQKQAEQKAQPVESAEAKPSEEASQSTDKKPGKLKSLALGNRDKKTNEVFLLNQIEALNVDIPDNRQRFLSYFTGTMVEKKGTDANKENKDNKENKENKKKKFLDEDDEVPAPPAPEERIEARSNPRKKTHIGAPPPVSLEEKKESTTEHSTHSTHVVKKQSHETERREIDPTFYYYKRWLWIMFPWVCLSAKKEFNFSKIIYECFSSATEYISVADEREKTRQALKIAIEAKLKKQSVYAAKDISLTSTSRMQKEASTGKSSKKLLPPLKGAHQSMGGETDTLFNSTNNKTMRLDTLSPVHDRPTNKKLLVNPGGTQKDPHFFITSDFLTPHYVTDLAATNMEPSMIGKASLASNTTFQSVSMLNRSSNQRGDKSMSNLAVNKKVEEMLRNANEAIQTLILPKYQDSLLVTSGKQIDDLEAKVKYLQSQFDELAYMTKMSSKKLKDLSIVEGNLKAEGVADAVLKAQARIDELQAEIAKANKMKNDAVSQGERLSKVILVCVKNKTQNVLGVQSLNYLLNNFKKVIIWAKENANETLKSAVDLEKLSKQYLKAYDERLKQQERAVMHIRREKMTSVDMEKKLNEVYDKLEQTAVMTNEEMRTKQKMQKEAQEKRIKLETMRERTKNVKESIEEMREMYEQIKNVIGLDFESTKFLEFLDYIEKINDFQKSIYESENESKKLKEELLALTSYLETLKKAKGSEKKPVEVEKAPYKDLTDKDQLSNILLEKKRANESLNREIAKRTQLSLNTQLVLEKIYKELDIPVPDEKTAEQNKKIPTEEILKKLEDRLKVIKESLSPEEFEKFTKGQADLSKNHKREKTDFAMKRDDDDRGEGLETNVFRKGARIIETKFD